MFKCLFDSTYLNVCTNFDKEIFHLFHWQFTVGLQRVWPVYRACLLLHVTWSHLLIPNGPCCPMLNGFVYVFWTFLTISLLYLWFLYYKWLTRRPGSVGSTLYSWSWCHECESSPLQVESLSFGWNSKNLGSVSL